MFRVFHRTWWVENAAWPNGLEPGCGDEHTIAKDVPNEDAARKIARAWNATHAPGRLSDKAEIEEQ
jgi:hypothetical protein